MSVVGPLVKKNKKRSFVPELSHEAIISSIFTHLCFQKPKTFSSYPFGIEISGHTHLFVLLEIIVGGAGMWHVLRCMSLMTDSEGWHLCQREAKHSEWYMHNIAEAICPVKMCIRLSSDL